MACHTSSVLSQTCIRPQSLPALSAPCFLQRQTVPYYSICLDFYPVDAFKVTALVCFSPLPVTSIFLILNSAALGLDALVEIVTSAHLTLDPSMT